MKNLNDSPNQSNGEDKMQQFVELYSQHHSRLHYFLMALVPTLHDAGDILQETSLILWKKFDSFEPGTNFMAWACQIARLQAMEYRRERNRFPKLFEAEVFDLLSIDAEEAASRPEVELSILEQCVSRLSAKDQMLIRRRYEPGSSVKLMALNIGRSANSVSKSLGRIRGTLLECVERKLPEQWRQASE